MIKEMLAAAIISGLGSDSYVTRQNTERYGTLLNNTINLTKQLDRRAAQSKDIEVKKRYGRMKYAYYHPGPLHSNILPKFNSYDGREYIQWQEIFRRYYFVSPYPMYSGCFPIKNKWDFYPNTSWMTNCTEQELQDATQELIYAWIEDGHNRHYIIYKLTITKIKERFSNREYCLPPPKFNFGGE